jgi:Spy/CpxP family protein refolding chaperone
MKTFTLALATLGLAVAAPTFAQIPTRTAPAQGHRHGGGRLQKLAAHLGLSDAQKAQLRPILQSARQQTKAIRADATLTPAARQAKMKDLHRSTRRQMLAILTPEQRQKLKTMRPGKPGNG